MGNPAMSEMERQVERAHKYREMFKICAASATNLTLQKFRYDWGMHGKCLRRWSV